MSVIIFRPWFIILFFFVLINGEEVQTKKETGKVIWSVKSPCKKCINIAMCPLICGTKIPTTPLPIPATKPPPTKLPPTFPLTPRPPTTTIPPPTLPPPTQPGTTKSPVTPKPPVTPAPPIQPPPAPTPPPPVKPPATTPLPPAPAPTSPPPVKPPAPTTSPPSPAPTLSPPSPAPTPPPPIQPPLSTPPPPVKPTSPTPPVKLPSSTPVPPIQPTLPTPVPPAQPGELSCPVVIEKKGCFKDDQKPPRPLPNYILTDRDSSLKIYSGQGVDWRNWVNYLPDLVCRCAQLAKSKNFKFFGIQYYGECWSGPSHDESSFKEDGISTECVNTEWKECSDQSKFACAGKQFNNYVYAINS